MMTSLIIRLIILIILFFQSISDIKTKTVYVLPNNFSIILSCAYFFMNYKNYEAVHITEMLFAIILLVILGLTKKIGSGDIKVMISMYIVLDGAFHYFVIYLIISCISFLIIEEIIKPIIYNYRNSCTKIKLFSIQKAAFFPYLFLGYLFDLLFLYFK